MVKKRNIFLTLFSLFLVVILSIPMFCVSVSADEQLDFNGSHLLNPENEIVLVQSQDSPVMPNLKNYSKVKRDNLTGSFEDLSGKVVLVENFSQLEYTIYFNSVSGKDVYSNGFLVGFEGLIPAILISHCSDSSCSHYSDCKGFSVIFYVPEDIESLYNEKIGDGLLEENLCLFFSHGESDFVINTYELVPSESSSNNQSSNNQTPVGKVNSGSFVQKISITLSAIMLVLLIAFIYHIITYNKKKNRKK